ncbi:MAG TPA: phosphodiester glycosidase family protein [Gemmatimonas sp.]|uniref:phosphodiester glycosidase family protein n=1 Tax=Gemmatimonas sp. TaxID=1962908 RepID=UPI002ED7C9FE
MTSISLQTGAQRSNSLTKVAFLILGMLAACRPAAGTPGDVRPSRNQLAPGLQHEVRLDPRGPWRFHIVEIDLQNAALSMEAVRAKDALQGRERTSSMAKRMQSDTSRVRVAVNADFFDLANGENENNQVLRGEWWKGLPLTDSPYDTYDNVHGQVAIDPAGGLTFGRFILDARAWTRTGAVPVLSINSKPKGRYEGTALYTPRFGAAAPTDTGRVAELRLRPIGVRGDTLLYAAPDTASSRSGGQIPREGALLVGTGDRAAGVAALSRSDTVRVHLNTWPRLTSQRTPQALLGGWPLLLVDGENVAARAATLEGTISRNAEARHPRTAIAVSRSGHTAWLVTVDGRATNSVGMTLVELAEFLRTLGAWSALNFDGGGSTTMVIDGRVVNVPTDATGEREVGNALIVRERTKK